MPSAAAFVFLPAIAEAFRAGNLGVMDFARYRNVLSDTAMREAIAGNDEATPTREPGSPTASCPGCRVASSSR